MGQTHRFDGGDLGRRSARRRRELGLTREEVAERAGMAPGYVAYMEENPAQVTRGSLYRLAEALQTTPDHLLGTDTGIPPGSTATAVPAPLLTALDSQECMELIARGGIGRIAFTSAGTAVPTVLPVNFALAGGSVVLRTREGGVIAEHAPGPVAFEVDRIDDAMSQGWSVLVRGVAHRVRDAAERAALEADTDVRPWAGGEREVWIRVVPEAVSGRRVADARRP
ncbi:helix-turn-helix domain-containing protein [Streptomonospora nanhaiensis]|uniref:helix-turn-helix domain-containing protein n=1 Tax=Streptomonospora nanhaiensis TaxID=1323731 RepID=UPI001C3939AF|nr:pyridoxamine 5'-phosphate oxidase family protein [Streptomonospora nanhaiensis]MBV2364148.1 pyridoxamine 5'-phosphate oxidase family protein [Streptomonospora nanhaiensis]MBX9389457.1 pyridoxamine 5'-phosphate oxidase family protein [Streptomonospora nanhaiensis]